MDQQKSEIDQHLILSFHDISWRRALTPRLRNPVLQETFCPLCLKQVNKGFCRGLSIAFIALYQNKETLKSVVENNIFADTAIFFQLVRKDSFNHPIFGSEGERVSPTEIHLRESRVEKFGSLDIDVEPSDQEQVFSELSGILTLNPQCRIRISLSGKKNWRHSIAIINNQEEEQILLFDSNTGVMEISGNNSIHDLISFLRRYFLIRYSEIDRVSSWSASLYRHQASFLISLDGNEIIPIPDLEQPPVNYRYKAAKGTPV